MIGNYRVNALASDEGYVSLFGCDRGPNWVNYFDDTSNQLGGGFSYIHATYENATNNDVMCSAYKYAPMDDLETAVRKFGIGYYMNSIVLDGMLEVQHSIYAPFGDDPILIDEVTIRKVSDISQKTGKSNLFQ